MRRDPICAGVAEAPLTWRPGARWWEEGPRAGGEDTPERPELRGLGNLRGTSFSA